MKPILEAREVTVLTGPSGTFKQALAFAKQRGTRLFTRAEAQFLFETSEVFRVAVRDSNFWVLESASVDSRSQSFAWLFLGNYGNVYDNDHNNINGVRCVRD